MTNEEAVDIIRNAKRHYVFSPAMNESINMAIEALKNIEHGEWSIAIGYNPKKPFLCSKCSLMNYEPTDYCPHCGARMGKVTE